MKKIAYIIPNYDDGGMPRVLESLSLGLNDKYQQYLIVLIKGRDFNFRYNAKVIEILEEGTSYLDKSWIFFKRIQKIRELKKKEKFDIVLSFGVAANLINVLSRGQEKVLLSEHNVKSIENKAWGLYGFFYNFLMKKYYKKADQIITVSEFIKEDLITNYSIERKKIVTIYNGFDIDNMIKLSEEKLNIKEKNSYTGSCLINIGRLEKQKGQWHLIRIMPYLLKKVVDLNLIILGDGIEKEKLEKLSKKLQVEDRVQFVGFKKNPYPYIKEADIFVFSSIYEGFGNVLIEAMSLGKPVISTDCKAGPREILQNKLELDKSICEMEFADYGILVPALESDFMKGDIILTKNEKILADAILKLFYDKEKYKEYSLKAKERALYFSSKNMVENYIKLF